MDDALPLYHKIKTSLERRIAEGELKKGEFIPTEGELEAYYKVSRTTIRKAVGMLVDEGTMTIVRGRGTIVTPSKLNYKVADLMSFTELMKQQGLRPSTTGIRIERKKPSPDIQERLGLRPGEDVVEISRVRTADDEPITINSSFIPLRYLEGKDLSVLDRKQSLYKVLEEDCNLEIHSTEDTIQALRAGRAQAEILHIGVGDPLLYIERLAYLKNGELVEFSRIFIRGDRYKHTITLRKH
jgi:GntR family transcriptional regulator